MRGDAVTYEDVRKACCAIISEGDGPSRPKVQEKLLASIGRKGSHSVVQGFINEFWAETSDRMNKATRYVADVPEEFVSILDRALAEMVAASRKILEGEISERSNALDAKENEWKAAVQQANDAAANAEQLRLRTEGELNGMQAVVTDLRVVLRATEDKLSEESRKGEGLQLIIESKDAELTRQFESLAAAGLKLEQANESHQLEVRRLMKQVDDERQAAKQEAQRLNRQLDATREDAEAVRKELAAQREENARLKAEHGAQASTLASQAKLLSDLNQRIETATNEARNASHELTAMRVRYDTAESIRQQVSQQCTSQAEELGNLRRMVERQQEEISALSNKDQKKK